MSRYPTIDLIDVSSEKKHYNRRNHKLKQHYLKLSDALRSKITNDTANVFRIRGIGGSRTDASLSNRSGLQNSPSVLDEHPTHLPSNGAYRQEKMRNLPKIQIVRDGDEKRKIKSETPPNILTFPGELDTKPSAYQYRMAPHLNLQKTIYLFKRGDLDPQCSNYLTNLDRKEKSFQFHKFPERRSLQNRKQVPTLRQYEQLTGFQTTLYEKPIKNSYNRDKKLTNDAHKVTNEMLATNKKIPIVSRYAQFNPNTKKQKERQEFTPWHIPEKSIQL